MASSRPTTPTETAPDTSVAPDEPQHALTSDENDETLLEAVLGHTANVENDASRHDHVNQSCPQHKEDEADSEFAVGDHVYQWCSFAGIPGVFQHHGIVIQVMDGRLTIADFSGMISNSGSTTQEGADAQEEEEAPKKSLFSSRSISSMREYTVEEPKEKTKWKKVRYNAGWLRRAVWRSGTCTSIESDPPGLVLARVHFLLENQHNLPPYHALKYNCECVAVWCKTGTWATLQASSFLEITAAGQAKSATTLALYASSQTVTVPAAGMWGWMGFTTKVSLLSMHPLLIPVLAGYGVLSIGGPVWMLRRCKHAWNETTTKLNDEFWQSAVDRPDVFVECITHWSEM